MDKIYRVKLNRPYDHCTYYVSAADIVTAAGLALQADRSTDYGKIMVEERAEKRAVEPRVCSIEVFCDDDQFVR